MSSRIESISVDSPDKIPRKEHWAIIEGSSVSHEESGVWAPGHGYPAYSEKIITYRAYFNEAEFIEELTHKFNSSYSSSVIGIHVDSYYTKQTSVKVQKV